MADTGERREIKERTDAKEEEVVAESKKLLQQSMSEVGADIAKTPSRQHEGRFANEPITNGSDDSRQWSRADSECENEKDFTMSESRNKRVLIVDNDEEEAARLGTELQRAGYDSNATWSGLDALELLKSGSTTSCW